MELQGVPATYFPQQKHHQLFQRHYQGKDTCDERNDLAGGFDRIHAGDTSYEYGPFDEHNKKDHRRHNQHMRGSREAFVRGPERCQHREPQEEVTSCFLLRVHELDAWARFCFDSTAEQRHDGLEEFAQRRTIAGTIIPELADIRVTGFHRARLFINQLEQGYMIVQPGIQWVSREGNEEAQ